MRIDSHLIPQELVDQHKLEDAASNGKVLEEMRRGAHGFTRSGALVCGKLKKRFHKHNYE